MEKDLKKQASSKLKAKVKFEMIKLARNNNIFPYKNITYNNTFCCGFKHI